MTLKLAENEGEKSVRASYGSAIEGIGEVSLQTLENASTSNLSHGIYVQHTALQNCWRRLNFAQENAVIARILRLRCHLTSIRSLVRFDERN